MQYKLRQRDVEGDLPCFMQPVWEAEWPWWGRLLSAEPSGNYCPVWTLQAADQIKRLYDLFLKVDATQVEVNPLGETPEGQGTLYHREMNVFLSVCAFVF